MKSNKKKNMNGGSMGLEEHLWQLAFGKGRSRTGVPHARFLYSIWSTYKERVSLQIATVSPMFSTYSDHGPHHSHAIIASINRILGKRVCLLSPTDTWMLLECAYRHDVGMHVADEDIRVFIKTEDYRVLLKTLSNSGDDDLRNAALSLLSPVFPDDNTGVDEIAEKILDLGKSQNLALQQHFRKEHGNRSAKTISDEHSGEAAAGTTDSLVPKRLWKLIAKICLGHTQDRDFLMKYLPQQTNGFCDDTAHPRFVFFLLRLGDLLDMDNNRFNPYQTALWGKDLPTSSKAHMLKHSAVEHLFISPESIEISARIEVPDSQSSVPKTQLLADDEARYKKERWELSHKYQGYSVKKIISALDKIRWNENDMTVRRIEQANDKTRQAHLLISACTDIEDWFTWIEDELKYIAINWLDIKPHDLPGNIPRLRKAEIWFQGRQLERKTIKLRYSISHYRAANIIQGTGLYGSSQTWGKSERYIQLNSELVFIREFLQNAMDATHLQVFRYLLQGRYGNPAEQFGRMKTGYSDNDPTEYVNVFSEWHPVQVLTSIGEYIKNINVVLRIRFYTKRDGCQLLFIFRDSGTGINRETLKYMSTIGKTRSDNLLEEIKSMPEWLRPNGSFGIGMQSVFGVVEKFSAVSGSRKDHKIRDIYFENTQNDGQIFAIESMQEADNTSTYGTKIIVPMTNEQIQAAHLFPSKGVNFFDRGCEALFKEIGEQLDRMVGNHIFPLKVSYYIDDVEVDSLRKPYDSVFKPLIECKYKIINPDGSVTAIILPGTSKDTHSLRIVSYQVQENVIVDMELVNIKDDLYNTIDVRYGQQNIFYPIDFYYRGLRVPNVQLDKQMLYPCWSIKAYAFFGNAEEYVAINRNQLLPNKHKHVYMLVSACADKAINALWESEFIKDDIIINLLEQPQINALAISCLFQTVTERVKPVLENDLHKVYDANLKKLLERTTCNIASMSYSNYGNRLYSGRQPLKSVFYNGIESCWLLNKYAFFNQDTERPECFENDDVTLMVQDIFTEYLTSRGLKPCAKLLSGFVSNNQHIISQSPHFIMSHKMASGYHTILETTEGMKKFWLQKIRENCSNLHKNNGQDKSLSRLIILPVFTGYERLAVNSLPDEFCPDILKCLGSYLITPISYEDVTEWLNAPVESSSETSKDSVKQKIINNILNATKKEEQNRIKHIYRDTPQGQLALYIFEHRRSSDPNLTLEQIGQLLCELVHDFFLC